jgi:hypothetical protein
MAIAEARASKPAGHPPASFDHGGPSLLTYFAIVRPLRETLKIREEEKKIFTLTATPP